MYALDCSILCVRPLIILSDIGSIKSLGINSPQAVPVKHEMYCSYC